MSDLVERLRQMTGRHDLEAADEIERLREKLSLARSYVYANQGGWCRDGITSKEVLERTADQPSPILDKAPPV